MKANLNKLKRKFDTARRGFVLKRRATTARSTPIISGRYGIDRQVKQSRLQNRVAAS